MKVALDTNCFIDAITEHSHAYAPMQTILGEAAAGRLELFVSRHTLAELELRPDAASSLAKRLKVLPHWPIGTWGEQVARLSDLEGTYDDALRNDGLQRAIQQLAKAGNDIRDRGAYIDALRAGLDVFVTSDGQLVGSGPASRLEAQFGLRVLRPADLELEIQGT